MVKVDPARHRRQPWRVHTLAPDYELLDVWEVPIQADPSRGESFDLFFELVWENGMETGSPVVTALVRLRALLGRVFRWERQDLSIPGARERSIAERLTDDDRKADRAPEPRSRPTAIPVRLIYRFADEALIEVSNATIAALVHLGWVALPDRKNTAELAVYIKSRGLGSRMYMSLIEPFRGWFVYPAWTAQMARLWRDRRAAMSK
jgi:hypothetical protein